MQLHRSPLRCSGVSMGRGVHGTILVTLLVLLVTFAVLQQHQFTPVKVRHRSTRPGRGMIADRLYPEEWSDQEIYPADYQWDANMGDEEPGHNNSLGLVSLDSVRRPVQVIIVASSPRSGSSFLGDLVSSPNEAMYLYEPVWYHDRRQHRAPKRHFSPYWDQRVRHDLRSLLQCRFEKLAGMFGPEIKMPIWKKPKIFAPLTTHQRTSLCKDLPLRVIKLIRVQLHSILPLLKARDLNLHIIHLVRDPRGIVNSVDAFDGWHNFYKPRDVCNNIRNDLQAFFDHATRDHATSDEASSDQASGDQTSSDHREHRRLLRVRYEDVVANPQKEVQRIYNMLGLHVPEEVEKFLDLHSRQRRPNATASTTASASNPTEGSSSAAPVTETVATSIDASVTDTPPGVNATSTNAASANAASNNATSTTAKKKRRKTTPTERKQKSTTLVPPGAFKDRYSTIRDATFDGLQWIRNLDRNLRKETERECKDVLYYLKYPLVYPQEQMNQTTEVPVTEVPVTEVPVTEVPVTEVPMTEVPR